jgi:hypothetical protein
MPTDAEVFRHADHSTARPARPGKYDGWEAALLDARAAELRSQGMTLREIGVEMNVNHKTAGAMVRRAALALEPEAVAVRKQTQLDSLERQKRVILGILATPTWKVDHGKVVLDPIDGQPMVDKELVIKASAELRKIEQDISRLIGTRAPVVKEVHEYTEEGIDAELRRLVHELGSTPGRVGDTLEGTEAPALAAAEGAGGGGGTAEVGELPLEVVLPPIEL